MYDTSAETLEAATTTATGTIHIQNDSDSERFRTVHSFFCIRLPPRNIASVTSPTENFFLQQAADSVEPVHSKTKVTMHVCKYFL